MKTILAASLFVSGFAFATPLLAAGDDHHMTGGQHMMESGEMMAGAEHHGPRPWGAPGDPKNVDRTVTIEASEIAFDVKDLTFRKGETVRFVLVNKGEQPHEFAIGDAAEQAGHRRMMQEMAGMDMAAMGHDSQNAVSTEPGETKEFVWTFTQAGTFDFACNYPGHAELGMEGRIVVK